MAKALKDNRIEHIDPETGEVTYGDPPAAATEAVDLNLDVDSIPEAETVEAAGEDIGPTEIVDPVEGIAEPERIHAYDAGEFHPELNKLEGQMRDFMLTRIRNNWKPWQQMTVNEQQDLVNAIEQQSRDTIKGIVRALNDHEWPYCTVTLGQVTINGGDKGIEAKITCANVDDNRNFLGEHVDSQVMIIVTNAEDFFGSRDRVKYDGKNSQMDLPLGGSVKDIEEGGFAAEEEALQAPVLGGPEPDAFAPEPGEEDADGEQLGEREPADDDVKPADDGEEPGEA